MKLKSQNLLSMFWTEFKNYKIPFILLGFLFFSSCNEESNTSKSVEVEEKTDDSTKLESEKEQIIRQVEGALSIPATEKYDIQIQYEFINEDTLRDAVILVNRKEFAFEKAKNTNTERFFEETGNTGLYNYVFLKLGGKDRIISTNPVGSNANYPLEVKFIELTSKAHTDFYVEYRVRNSLHRNYYTLRRNDLFLTFSCPQFDKIGEEQPLVYDIKHPSSSVRIAKDIALYKGQIVDYSASEIKNTNFYTPKEITSNGELFVYFVFNEKTMKYVTPMPAMEK